MKQQYRRVNGFKNSGIFFCIFVHVIDTLRFVLADLSEVPVNKAKK